MGNLKSKHTRYEVSTPPKSELERRGRGEGVNRSRRDDFYARRSGLKPHPESAVSPEDRNLQVPPKGKRILHVKDVDLCIKQNTYDHITDKYELTEEREEDGKKIKPNLVIRRGKPFDIVVKFDRAFEKEKDDLKIILEVGPRPLPSRGTSVVIVLSDEDKPNQWGAMIKEVNGKDVTLRIFTPGNCIVGKWTLKLEFKLLKDAGTGKPEEEVKKYRYVHEDPIYMLFNPWCPDDICYLEDETLILEYVLNDMGKIYAGNYKQIGSKPWTFGQFEDFVLDCAFYVLDKAELPYRSRNNPVGVVRKISAITNSLDDDGILVGNWSGDYSGGTAPTAWVGSVAILEEYWKTKQPVKFGQCWVFSGVVTTLCRALGIPCRSVTNFASAHDVDASITIDMYWTSDGKPMEDANFDSIWNFHVWNDVWMARPDLPPGYSGWQAIDATPQETSDGIYCSGPCSVNALRDGVITLPYDGPFIFAEVNADKVHYIQKSNGEFRSVIQKDIVGKRISTRLPDGFARRAVVGSIIDDPDRHDITSQYKHTEGTAEERAALMKAISTSTRQDIYDDVGDDVKFNFVDKDDIFIGSDFDVEVKVTNTSDEERNVTITLSATVCRYTGVPVAQLKNEQFQIKLEPKSEQSVKMACTVDEYLPKLVEGASMKIGGMAWVKETGQVHADLDDFRLRRPDLKVEAKCLDDSGIFRVGVPFDLVVSLTNPLNKQLTKCEWFIEGPGLQKPKRIKHASDVAANALVDLTYQMTPRRTGTRQIAVGFDTVELPDITGSAIIEVKPAA